MHKRNVPPYLRSCISEVNEMQADRQPPHIMKYCDGDRSIDLYLCCFCNSLPDISLRTACEHFHLVSNISCLHFSEVPDVIARIDQLLTAKEECQCDNGQI